MSAPAESDRDRRRSLARFQSLLERALFELRLASDIIRAEGYGPDLARGVTDAKRRLTGALAAARALKLQERREPNDARLDEGRRG